MPRLRGAAAKTVRDGFAETLAYTEFLPEHWRRIRTNNGIERIDREIRRRTRAAYYADFATPFHVPLLHRSAVG